MNISSVKQYFSYAKTSITSLVLVMVAVSAPFITNFSTHAQSVWMTEDQCVAKYQNSSDDAAVFNCINDRSTDAMVYRAYRVVLGRAPDLGGQKFWTDVANKEVKAGKDPVYTVVRRMAGSSEYGNKYMTENTKLWVKELYIRAYGQKGDATGMKYWENEINKGKRTHVQVMTYFAQDKTVRHITSIPAVCYVSDYEPVCHY